MMHRWTELEEARLRKMVADDRTAIEMAANLSVTRQAIYRKLRQLGLKVTEAAISRGKSLAGQRLAATPEGRAQRSRAGRQPMKRYGFANPRAAQRAGVEKRYEGVPPEYRDLYRMLVYSKHTRSADAKAMIAEMIAQEKARAEAAKTPFQRMLERGAKVGITERPRFASNDLTFSPTGCGLAL